jgi:hypothetical protein
VPVSFLPTPAVLRLRPAAYPQPHSTTLFPPQNQVNINLVRKTEENWVEPPEPKYVAFSGSGRTLGGARDRVHFTFSNSLHALRR